MAWPLCTSLIHTHCPSTDSFHSVTCKSDIRQGSRPTQQPMSPAGHTALLQGWGMCRYPFSVLRLVPTPGFRPGTGFSVLGHNLCLGSMGLGDEPGFLVDGSAEGVSVVRSDGRNGGQTGWQMARAPSLASPPTRAEQGLRKRPTANFSGASHHRPSPHLLSFLSWPPIPCCHHPRQPGCWP